MQRTPRLVGTARFRPARLESEQAERVPDRDEFVVFSPAAGAGCEVAGNPVARVAVEGANDVGADFAAPLHA